MQQHVKQKLDFRFADEMDGMDIVQFVNEAYSIEYKSESGALSFRKEGPKVHTEEVEGDLLAMPIKWLVLETPMPEELIVGAARLRYDAALNGRVDVFCVASSSSAEARDSTAKQLLSKVETVCYSIGLRSCILEAAQWRCDLETLFTACGYEERSGHVWPEEKQHELTKPTMVLEYHKVFGAQNEAGSSSSAGMLLPTSTSKVEVLSGDDDSAGADDLTGDIVGQLTSLNELAISRSGTNNSTGQGAAMPALFESLFAALHAEYGDGEATATTTGTKHAV